VVSLLRRDFDHKTVRVRLDDVCPHLTPDCHHALAPFGDPAIPDNRKAPRCRGAAPGMRLAASAQ
jgi:hypothetical protein